jgi:hypothetical protein
MMTLILAAALIAQDEPKCRKCGGNTYGTSVHWAGSPEDAAKKAKEQEKLVFILHVSGHFEDPKFT